MFRKNIKNNMKKAVILAMTATMTVSMFACGDAGSKAESKSETTSSQTTAALSAIRSANQVIYNNVTFGIGDNMNDILSKLGSSSAPQENVNSCLSGSAAVKYYYPSLTIEATPAGVIYYIAIMDNSYTGSQTPKTVKGIAVGSSLDDVKSQCGEATKSGTGNLTYSEDKFSAIYSYKDNKVTSVVIQDYAYAN